MVNEMPNFTGVSAMPRLRIGAPGVELAHRPPPAPIVARAFAAVDQRRQDIVLDRHAVGRDVAAFAIKVRLAHVERIEPERPRDLVDRALGDHHALRSAEAAEGRVGDRVGLHALGRDGRGRQVVGVVGVEHRAVVDRARDVGRIAAARRHDGFERADAALRVEPDLVVGEEIVPLAGQAHVVVAIEPDLARPPGDARGERRNGGPLRGLRLLAAERAAHAAHLDGDRRVRHVQHLGDQVLAFARMLRRDMHQHVAVLARNGERHLAFEIEVFLAADAQLSLDAPRARLERGGAVVLAERVVGQDVDVGRERIVDRDARRADGGLDLAKPRGAARLAAGPRHHREHDLAVELDLLRRRTPDRRRAIGADVVLAGDVGRGQHRDHAGRGAHRIEIDAEQLPGRDRRAADRDVQQALGLADVVDEGRAARDVLGGRVMPQRAAHDAQPQLLGAAVRQRRHRPPP